MRLGQLIESLEFSQHIRLGAAGGAGYFYIGTAGNCDLEKVGVRLLADMFKNLSYSANAYMRKRKKEWTDEENNRAKKALHYTLCKFGAFKPLDERAVKSLSWIESEDDCLQILVEGCEKGRYRHESDVTGEDTRIELCKEGAQALVDAVYKGVANELKENLRAMRSRNPKTVDRASEKAERLKRYFRYDPYGILTDSEAIIEACIKCINEEGL